MAGGTTGGAIFYRNSRRSWIWGWNDHPGDVDQAETELLNPQHSPGRFQMDGFENLDQGVSLKLKLKKDGCGQELFGQDMIDSESVFQFLDDVFRIAPLPVEPDDFRPVPIGVGNVESVTEPILGKKRPLIFFSANNDQAIGGSFLFGTEEVDRFADFFFSPAPAKRLPSSNPPNQGRNRLRLPSSNDESDTFPVAGFH